MGKIALCNVSYIDIEEGTVATQQTIEISANRIVGIYDTASHHPVNCDRIIDCTGCWVIPSFIDMHVHVSMSPYFEYDDYCSSPKDILEITQQNLLELRRIGVAICRDMGSFMHSTEWAKHLLSNTSTLPSIISCGDILTYPKGHMSECGREVIDLCDINTHILKNVNLGAGFIKVTSDPKDTEAQGRYPNPAFSAEHLNCIVKTAAQYNLSVACHTYPSASGVFRAVNAGVRTIEHAVPFTESLSKIFHPNTYYVPTFSTAVDICGIDSLKKHAYIQREELINAIDSIMPIEYRYDGLIPDSILEWFNFLVRNLPGAISSNQLLCTGSDAGCKGTNFATLLREIFLMCLFGATNLQALQFAITNPCKALGLKDAGKIAVGKVANMILLDNNPLDNILTLLTNVAVICNGSYIPSY